MSRLDELLTAKQAPMIRVDNQTSTARRPMATVIISDPETGIREFDTLMCIHCQFHWQVVPGSGRHRGWCVNCNGALCGKEKCMKECAHFMKQIEKMEAHARREANLALL